MQNEKKDKTDKDRQRNTENIYETNNVVNTCSNFTASILIRGAMLTRITLLKEVAK